MFLLLVYLSAGLNFLAAAAYLLTRDSRLPGWIYLWTALFCWWPAAIFPAVTFAQRRAVVRQGGDARAEDAAFRLSSAVWIASVLLQGTAAFSLGRLFPELNPSGDVVALFMAISSLLLTVLLLYGLHLLRKSAA